MKLLNLEESAKLARVSPSTIEQFKSYGLLQSVPSNNSADLNPPLNTSSGNVSSETEKTVAWQMEFFREEDIRTLFYENIRQNDRKDEPVANSQLETTITLDTLENQAQPTASLLQKDEAPTLNTTTQNTVINTQTGNQDLQDSTENLSTEDLTDIAKNSDNISSTEINSEFLININKGLQEQIEILREERDWLRSRVEKLETRSEREQMLLMAESENIRQLIAQRDKQRLSWLKALPWFKS